jgi:UDP-N-acetylmuramyl pentapeptide phosphotransferase/UDP-N-acetylglucosamine-1-phosphate transferase
MDDIFTLSSKIRLPIQLFSVFLLLYEVVNLDWIWLIIGLIVATGAVNAFNFMDGINGMTGGYSLITLTSLLLINLQIHFVDQGLLIFSALSVLVFNFFNFRTKAKCFAGDVGSVSIAFIIIFCIFLLIQKTESFWWLLLLMVYGMDSVVTILHRLLRRENIFDAHRSHLYQWLVKPGPFSHLQMATIYALLQLIINIVVFYGYRWPLSIQIISSVIIWLILGFTYLIIKKRYIHKYGLVQ